MEAVAQLSATLGALATSLLLGSDPVCGSALGTFEAGRRELDPYQGKRWNNYAVGFYNAPGGVTIGRVWADHGQPDPAVGLMPERTVAAKLLFATAPFEGVPYLAGAPTWNAYVYADPNDPKPIATSPRAVLPVRLLQIDIGSRTPGWPRRQCGRWGPSCTAAAQAARPGRAGGTSSGSG